MGPAQFWRMERITLFDNWNLMGIPLDSRLIEEYMSGGNSFTVNARSWGETMSPASSKFVAHWSLSLLDEKIAILLDIFSVLINFNKVRLTEILLLPWK